MIDIYLDPSTLVDAALADGARMVRCEDTVKDVVVTARVRVLPSGRTLIETIWLRQHDRPITRECYGDSAFTATLETARQELLGLIDPVAARAFCRWP